MANTDTDSGFFSKRNDLRNRILFTILILSVYRMGTYIPLPGIDPESLKTLMVALWILLLHLLVTTPHA